MCGVCCVFFFKQKTAYEMRISDWSSDVCSSDLGLAREQLDLKMAVWAPGSYLIREFPKNVEGFRALAGKKELQTEKISKNTWRIHTADVNEVTVTDRKSVV